MHRFDAERSPVWQPWGCLTCDGTVLVPLGEAPPAVHALDGKDPHPGLWASREGDLSGPSEHIGPDPQGDGESRVLDLVERHGGLMRVVFQKRPAGDAAIAAWQADPTLPPGRASMVEAFRRSAAELQERNREIQALRGDPEGALPGWWATSWATKIPELCWCRKVTDKVERGGPWGIYIERMLLVPVSRPGMVWFWMGNRIVEDWPMDGLPRERMRKAEAEATARGLFEVRDDQRENR